jgi:hypothetical protein
MFMLDAHEREREYEQARKDWLAGRAPEPEPLPRRHHLTITAYKVGAALGLAIAALSVGVPAPLAAPPPEQAAVEAAIEARTRESGSPSDTAADLWQVSEAYEEFADPLGAALALPETLADHERRMALQRQAFEQSSEGSGIGITQEPPS